MGPGSHSELVTAEQDRLTVLPSCSLSQADSSSQCQLRGSSVLGPRNLWISDSAAFPE